jgi:hypothetical protein
VLVSLSVRPRVNEIRLMKIKISDLRRQLHHMKTSVTNIDLLRREVQHLGRDLLQVSSQMVIEATAYTLLFKHCAAQTRVVCSLKC